ncbi:MAG: phosphoribosylamine--glycine ligase [bacterium]
MDVAVIGGGGREHALLRVLHESPSTDDCWVWPGNDGMLDIAQKLDAEDQEDCIETMKSRGVDLCVVGPESYLEDEFADECSEAGIDCWGPNAEAAQLETSKLFAKRFMNRHEIPTGGFTLTEAPDEIRDAVDEYPVALKFNGLAGGKGVTVCFDEDDVEDYIDEVYNQKRFGEPDPVLVEEFLEGVEVTVICAVNNGDYQVYPASRDYKPLNNGDSGPNTGGMGAVSSVGMLKPDMIERIENEIIQPTMDGLGDDGLDYQGFLYFGLMITDEGPKILEYNCRFGDPEAQATLPLLEGDFSGYLKDAINGPLDTSRIQFRDDWSVCVMIASENYPYDYSHGQEITGLDDVESARVYYSGIRSGDKGLEVDGGRILGVVGLDNARDRAREKAYKGIEKIHFDGMHYRDDIASLHFEDSTVFTH